MYGGGTTLRLKQAGMEFAVWVFRHASDAQLAPMAPAILQGLLRLLDSGTCSSLHETNTLDGFAQLERCGCSGTRAALSRRPWRRPFSRACFGFSTQVFDSP